MISHHGMRSVWLARRGPAGLWETSTSYLLHGEWTGPLAVELSEGAGFSEPKEEEEPGRYRLKSGRHKGTSLVYT
jgi:hypothetical protein